MKKTTKKATWTIRYHGWSGKPYTTTEQDGTKTYHPGTKYGWMDFKAGFRTQAEADKWLMNACRTKGWDITDFTIVKA